MQTASVKWIGEQKFVATGPSGHALTIDSDRASNKAPGPMELVLLALGACTATDVVILFQLPAKSYSYLYTSLPSSEPSVFSKVISLMLPLSSYL